MKKTLNQFGLHASLTVIILIIVNLVIVSKGDTYGIGEEPGYAAIALSLCFVYFGIRYYRDMQNNGVPGFWQGIKWGMLITLAPAFCFGVVDVI